MRPLHVTIILRQLRAGSEDGDQEAWNPQYDHDLYLLIISITLRVLFIFKSNANIDTDTISILLMLFTLEYIGLYLVLVENNLESLSFKRCGLLLRGAVKVLTGT